MAEKDSAEMSGRLRIQRAIINSEFLWFGRLLDSHVRHEMQAEADLQLRILAESERGGIKDPAENLELDQK